MIRRLLTLQPLDGFCGRPVLAARTLPVQKPGGKTPVAALVDGPVLEKLFGQLAPTRLAQEILSTIDGIDVASDADGSKPTSRDSPARLPRM